MSLKLNQLRYEKREGASLFCSERGESAWKWGRYDPCPRNSYNLLHLTCLGRDDRVRFLVVMYSGRSVLFLANVLSVSVQSGKEVEWYSERRKRAAPESFPQREPLSVARTLASLVREGWPRLSVTCDAPNVHISSENSKAYDTTWTVPELHAIQISCLALLV